VQTIDLLAGRVQVMISAPAAPGPHIRAGKLKGIAYSGSQRLHRLPMVPTFAEGGLPNYEARGWFGIIMHGNTPEPIKNMLAEAIWSIAKSPSYQANAIMAKVPIKLTGMVMMGMMEARKVRRKTKITKATKTTASAMV
jgi:tripartite-type tricarboxylate transporter receptor subunit TctC